MGAVVAVVGLLAIVEPVAAQAEAAEALDTDGVSRARRGPSVSFRSRWRAAYLGLLAERRRLAAPPRVVGNAVGIAFGLVGTIAGAGLLASGLERERCDGGLFEVEVWASSSSSCTTEPVGQTAGMALMMVGAAVTMVNLLLLVAKKGSARGRQQRLRDIDERLEQLRRVGPLRWQATASRDGARLLLGGRF